MSAKLVIAWILAILVILAAAGGLVFGFRSDRLSDPVLGLGIAALLVISAGLLYVMVRGRFADSVRLALSAAALVLSLALVVIGAFIASVIEF